MLAAIDALKQQSIHRITIAIPVASKESLETLSSKVDQTVCLFQPLPFSSIGEWYQDFSQVDDEQVTATLNRAWKNES